MSDWFHSLPVAWMALLVFGFTYFVVAVIYVVVRLLAVGERGTGLSSVRYQSAPIRCYRLCHSRRAKGGEKVCRTPGSFILASKYLPSCAI